MHRGKIIGDTDKFVVWHKPKTCSKALTPEEFATLPKTFTVREIYFYILIPGFRTKQVSVITTLLDAKTYSTLDIIRLYNDRWDVELDLKHLKTTLGMDVLRGKTPEMVHKEIWVFLLAYNLLRSLMWEGGTKYGVPPLRLSLQGTRQHFNNFLTQFLAASEALRNHIYQTLLKIIIYSKVPERPGRSEPRGAKTSPQILPFDATSKTSVAP